MIQIGITHRLIGRQKFHDFCLIKQYTLISISQGVLFDFLFDFQQPMIGISLIRLIGFSQRHDFDFTKSNI